MKKIFWALVFVAGMSFAVYAQSSSRHVEEGGGYSIQPPEGWAVAEFPGLKYKVFHGSPVHGFSPNIVFVDEYFEGTIEEYVQANNVNMRLVLTDFEILSTTAFVTASRLNGIKQVTTAAHSGQVLRQTFYYFSNGFTRFVITCSVPDNSRQSYEKLFDESVKTFQVTNK